jgi:hypothetical protein
VPWPRDDFLVIKSCPVPRGSPPVPRGSPPSCPAKVALVAVMRKLLVTLNVMIREEKTWREPSLAQAKSV